MIPYKHEPFTDFTNKENAAAIQAAIEKVNSELGKDYPLVIGGEKVTTEDKITSYNPANKEEVIGRVSKANQELAERAMQEALTAFDTWRHVDPAVRADVLFKAANIVRKRKHEFSAYLVKEAGKPWNEADADTAEAIDFMEYYARQMLELKPGKKVESRPGEYNRYDYIPLGVGVVISPWNFAFAIMAGTAVAAIVAGNAILLKPASATPIVAAKFVDHPKTRFISFTGSRDVGLRINERASKLSEGQIWLKRVIAEMGGKDTIVVDESADLELAAQSIVKSSFGFSGQKCSACSRAVIVDSVYDTVLDRVVELTNELSVGNTEKNEHFMGPVIDAAAFKKITSYFDVAKEEGRIVAGGKADDSTGYFIEPTVVADVDPKARLMQEEIFGPIVAFAKAKDFKEAIDIANNTEYGLTGAVLTRDRMNQEYARQNFHVGNLYFNRGCTGAIVGYQPFGGFNMSGTDSKAGGPDYIQLHMQAKTTSETF